MKISKIIDELTELKEYIGDVEVEGVMANSAVTSVNIMYLNDKGDWISTSLEDEKAKVELKATMSDQGAHGEIKVKVLRLDFCEASNDPDLVAMADVEVMSDHDPWFLAINGLGLRYNDTTKEYSIVAPKSLTGVCINERTQKAVASAVANRYEHIKHSDGGK